MTKWTMDTGRPRAQESERQMTRPAGVEPFDPITDLDLIPTRDHIVMQRVTITHGSIILAEATGVPKKGQEPDPKDFFGYVLAVGPGRFTANGERLPMQTRVGHFVRADGRLMFHHTPSHKRVWIASEDVVVGVLKIDTSAK